MVLMYFVPELVTWLPEKLYGGSVTADPGLSMEAPPTGGFTEEEAIR